MLGRTHGPRPSFVREAIMPKKAGSPKVAMHRSVSATQRVGLSCCTCKDVQYVYHRPHTSRATGCRLRDVWPLLTISEFPGLLRHILLVPSLHLLNFRLGRRIYSSLTEQREPPDGTVCWPLSASSVTVVVPPPLLLGLGITLLAAA